MASEGEMDEELKQLADDNPPEDHFAPRLIRRTSHFRREQNPPETIVDFQRRFTPKYRVLLPAPSPLLASSSREEIEACRSLFILWNAYPISQAPQPGDNPPIVPPLTVFYAAGRPPLQERRKFESSAEPIQLLQ